MQITTREKYFIIFGSVFILAGLIYLGAREFRLYYDKRAGKLENFEEENRLIEDLGRKYRLLLSYKSSGSSRRLNRMVAEIEQLVNSTGLRDFMTSLTPRENTIEGGYRKKTVTVIFRRTPARPVLAFIKSIEQNNRGLFRIDSFRSAPVSQKPGIYNFTIQIAGFEKTEGR